MIHVLTNEEYKLYLYDVERWLGGVEFKPIDGIIYQVIFNSSCWTKTDDAIYLHQLYRLNHK